MWVASEIAAMATDLAESIGAAIGISLLFHLPLLAGLLITFAMTWGLLTFQSRGFRPIELIITGFVGIISLAYLVELVIAPPDWGQFALPRRGAATRRAGQRDAGGRHRRRHRDAARDLPALGHDDEPGRRAFTDEQRRRLIGYSNLEVLIALSFAGLVNMAMVAMAATMFHQGHPDVGEIETAYHTLLPLMGVVAAGVFMTSLLASGLSSSVVGHDGRPGHHAGFRRLPDPDVGAAGGDHGAGGRRGGDGGRCDRGAGPAARWCSAWCCRCR